MLDKYKDNYEEFYNIFTNSIDQNKLNHAYMLEIDENIDIKQLENDLCKFIILKNKSDKHLENLIEENKYQNIRIIQSDGLWIKKEQILEIQNDFMKESFDNNEKIYIIEDATKLNKSSANTLLKFLEEPEKNIIAILITKNKYSVIKTIISRCINISLIKQKCSIISDEDLSYKAVELIEKYKINSLPYLYQLFINKNIEKTDLLVIFENMQKIYSDFLHIENNIQENYNYFTKSIREINYESNCQLLMKKINSINKNSLYLKNNVNIKTILDKIIIGIYGGE